MRKHKVRNVPVTLEGLNQKLDFEIKRLVREKEDGIAKYISKTAVLDGISSLVFKKNDGANITLSYRLDTGGALRFAREKQFADLSQNRKSVNATTVGRESGNISK